MTWVCEDCGWHWLIADRGQVIEWCDACDGKMLPDSDDD